MEEVPKKDWNYRLVNYFLHHRQLAVMCLIVIILGGLVSLSGLRVEGFPKIQVPIAVVTAVAPGAGPETVANTVTAPIESAIRDAKGVKEVSSTSQSNFASVFVQFDEGVNVNSGIQEVRTKLASVSLPAGVETPDIFVPETSGAPFTIGVSANKSIAELLADSESLRTKLLSVDGVKSVELASKAKEKIYIELAPQFQSPQVLEQITAANTGFPLGQIEINGAKSQVVGDKFAGSIEDLQNLPIRLTGPDGNASVVHLRDIAQVYTGIDYGGQIHRMGFKDGNTFTIQSALLYEVRLTADTDLLAANDTIHAALQDLEREHAGTKYVIVLDEAENASQQVNEILTSAIGGAWDSLGNFSGLGYIFGGIWLLVIAMFLFVDWRSAIISALAIPLSFFCTFIFLYIAGIQLNTIVLFSMILVLGLIVDPAIVVLESIKRYLEIGYKGTSAVLRSIETIGGGVFIAVLTSLIVFIPFAIVSGTFGQIIKYIPLTVIPALIASYFIPLLFLTWFAGRFLKAKHAVDTKDENDPRNLWPAARWFIRANRYILRHWWLKALIIILGLVIPIGISGALFGSGKVQQVQFAKPNDVDYLTVTVPLKGSPTEAQLLEQNKPLEAALATQAAYIQSYFYGSLDGTGGQGSLSLVVHLLAHADRTKNSGVIADELENSLKTTYGEKASVGELGAGPPEAAFPVSVKIFENDNSKLLAASKRIADELHTYSEVSIVSYYGEDTTQNVSVTANPEAASQTGLTAPALYGQLAGMLGERTLFVLGERDVVLRTPQNAKPSTVDAIRNLNIYGSTGLTTVGAVANVAEVASATTISKLNGQRFATVSAGVKNAKDAISVQRKIDQWAKDNADSLGVPKAAFDNPASQDEFEKSFQELFLAIALSILFSYIVFVLFFRSFLQPLIILFSIPLLFVGAFPALYAFAGGQLGFLEVLGVIMVIGIVENVGIFLIDFANRKVVEGMDKNEAIALSSGIRLRPVVLTKLTALAGLLPLAVFAPFWRGLAVVVIAGIISSGILSLFTTPVLYSWFTRKPKPVTEEL
jgi:HAE1 family hydrophobic/amphiphilic exporter-1